MAVSAYPEERLEGVDHDLEILQSCEWMQNQADVISCLDVGGMYDTSFEGIRQGFESWTQRIQPARMSAFIFLGHGENCEGRPYMTSADGASISILNLYTYLCQGRPCTCAALFFSCCQSDVSFIPDERLLFEGFPARLPDNICSSQVKLQFAASPGQPFLDDRDGSRFAHSLASCLDSEECEYWNEVMSRVEADCTVPNLLNPYVMGSGLTFMKTRPSPVYYETHRQVLETAAGLARPSATRGTGNGLEDEISEIWRALEANLQEMPTEEALKHFLLEWA